MAQSQVSVLKLYRSVIEDVITGVRDSFLDEGVDEQVLQELKQIWENKLISSKAVELNPDPPEPQPPQISQKDLGRGNAITKSVHLGNQTNIFSQHPTPIQHQSIVQQHQSQGALTNNQQQIAPQPQQHQQLVPAPTQPSHTSVIVADPNKQVPIQITLPAQGGEDSQPRVLTIQVPASALQGNQLHTVLTGPVISATMALPPHLASTLLQQHVTAALQGQAASSSVHIQSAATPERQAFQPGAIRQLDGAVDVLDEDANELEHESSVMLNEGVSMARYNVLQSGVICQHEDTNDLQESDLSMKTRGVGQLGTFSTDYNKASCSTSHQLDDAIEFLEEGASVTKHHGFSSSAVSQLGKLNKTARKSGLKVLKHWHLHQLDGHQDTSDEDEDEDDDEDLDDDDENEDKDEDENEEENNGGQEEEPLNSEDDVSDEDPTDLFDTDNVVVCQYDKITRSRNKWKFYLKDGIMNLNGKDFVFQKASGDAEW